MYQIAYFHSCSTLITWCSCRGAVQLHFALSGSDDSFALDVILIAQKQNTLLMTD